MEQSINSIQATKRTIVNRHNRSAGILAIKIPTGLSAQDAQKEYKKEITCGLCCTALECCLCLGTSAYLYYQVPALAMTPTCSEAAKTSCALLCGYGNVLFCKQEAKRHHENAHLWVLTAAVAMKNESLKNSTT